MGLLFNVSWLFVLRCDGRCGTDRTERRRVQGSWIRSCEYEHIAFVCEFVDLRANALHGIRVVVVKLETGWSILLHASGCIAQVQR